MSCEITEVMECECSSMEHIVYFKYWDNEPEVYVCIHLKKHGFWKRLKYAFKYLFGYQCKYGAFEEIILGTKQYNKILKIDQHLKPFYTKECLEYVEIELSKLEK